MNPEQAIFEQAMATPSPEARERFLAGACGGNRELRRSIDQLLAAFDDAGQMDFLKEGKPSERTQTVPMEVRPEKGAAIAIGRYKLLEKIGEGGFGEVWMADQREPVKRRVAVKLIKPGMDSRQIAARFEAERQALALMDHANIAKVFDAGATEAGRPYFVMELVRGIRITEYCDQNRLSTRERLRLFILVCQAIQHAHQKGIIHRDIKPSNILVTLHDGVPVPKVIDFGIAKATQQELTDKTVFTQFQQFIGTPAYISPEQAEMSGLDIDTRADIYSLGVLLYELLVGQTPFDAKEMMQGGLDALRQIIREKEPLRPSTKLNTLAGDARTTAGKRRQTEVGKLVHQLRGDLDWIVMKCLEKDRARRYDTATGLAADIQRHLANEPIVARPPSAGYRFQKLVHRNKLAFAAAGMIVTVLLLGVVVSTWQAIRATQAELEQGHLRQLAEAEQHKAEEAQGREVKQRQFAEAARQNEALLRQQAQAHELVARRTAYNSDMNLAQQALQLNNIGRAMEILNRHRPKPGEIDPRGWEWRFLWRSCQSDALFTLCHRPDEIFSVSFTHDGRYLAVGDEGSEVSVWELVSRKRVMSRKTGVDRQRIAFSPLTNLLAFSEKGSAGQYAVRLWNVEKGQGVRQWVIPGKGRELVFAKDGKSLAAWSEASAQSDERIFLWDVDSGRTLFETAAKRGGDAMGNLLALSEGAQTLAYGSTGGEVVLIDLATGREKSRLHVTDDLTMAVAISDDGRMLASAAGFADPVVKLWDLATGKVAAHLEGHRSYVNALAFSPDGRRLASASGDQTIRIWDWKERRSLTALRGHSSEVLAVTFSPDGQTLASGGKDWNVFIWNTTSNRNARGYELFPVHPLSWSFAGDGGSIIGLDSNGVVRSWATAGLQEHRRFEVLGTSNTSFALSKSGGLLAVGTQTGGVHVVHLLTDDEAGSFRAGSGSLKILGFGGEENFLLTLDQDRLVSQWDVRSGKRTHQWQIPEPFSRIQLNRAADFLATGGRDQLVLWRTTDGQRVWTAATGHESYQPAFSHDGKFVAVPNGKGFTMLFDTRNGAELMTLGGLLLGASSAAFSPDDQRLLIGGSGNEAVKMWDTELRQELLTLEGQGSFFGPPKFSPDGCVLASRSRKGLHFWRAPSWTDIAVAEAKENAETKPHGAKR